MYTDKLVKILNKTVDSFKYQVREYDPPFRFPVKALIVLPNFIGDVVLLTPLIRNLRYNFKGTQLDVVCVRSIYNLIETLPYIDRFYINDDISDKADFLRKQKYDTVFLFNFPFLWAIASYQAGIEQRISFNTERIGLYYPPVWQNLITHLIKSTPINDRKPQWKVYLNTLKDLGLKQVDKMTEIIITNDDINHAKSILKNIKKPLFSIHVTAGSYGKHWNLNNWIEVINYLKNKHDCLFIAFGTEQEKDIYDFLAGQTGALFLNMCGKTTIRETVAFYRHLDLMITLDTSSAHLAAAANTRNIIIIYGPTNQEQWKPYSLGSNIQQVYLNLSCRPCLTRICHHRNCLNKLSPDLVIKAVDKVYGRK